jgi:hypothetical protein
MYFYYSSSVDLLKFKRWTCIRFLIQIQVLYYIFYKIVKTWRLQGLNSSLHNKLSSKKQVTLEIVQFLEFLETHGSDKIYSVII